MLQIVETEIVLFISFLISSVAGFAGAAIAVPICTAILGLSNAKAVVNIISIAFNGTITIQHREKLNVKELIPVLSLVLTGMIMGAFINNFITADEILIRILGVIILVITLIRLIYNKELKLSKPVSVVILLLSGIVNYLFLCGGLVMVLYTSTRYKEKELFRCNNSFLFIIQSVYMCIMQYFKGIYTRENVTIGLIGVVPVIIATIIGKCIVGVISQKKFEKIIYILMIVMSISLLI